LRGRAGRRRQGILRRASRRNFRDRPAAEEHAASQVERSGLHAGRGAATKRQGRDHAPWALHLRGRAAMRRLCAFGLLLFACQAGAAITCSALVTSITIVYDPTSGTQNVTTGSYTVTCIRLATDPNTFSWQLGVDDGLQPAGGLNRVQSAAKRYTYDTWRLSPYNNANKWGDAAATRFTGTLNFGASLSASTSGPFDIVMAAGQAVQPAGTYTDTVTASLRNSGGTLINTSTFGVTVLTTN